MSKINKLKVWEAVGKGFKIPFANPSIFIPSALYSFAWSLYMFFTAAVYQVGEESEPIRAFTGVLSIGEFVFFSLLVSIISVLIYIIISKMAYDAISGGPNISEAFFLSVKKLIPIIIVSILYALIVLLGLVLLILPGIFLNIMLIFCVYFILFDNKGVISSFSASWQLVRGNWWRVFAWLLIWMTILILPLMFITSLERIAETITLFLFYLLVYPLFYSSSVFTYKFLRDNQKGLESATSQQ